MNNDNNSYIITPKTVHVVIYDNFAIMEIVDLLGVSSHFVCYIICIIFIFCNTFSLFRRYVLMYD